MLAELEYKSKIKVCHLTSVHPVEDVRIFHKECTSLAKNVYEVFLVHVSKELSTIKNGVNLISTGKVYKSRIKRILFSPIDVLKKALATDSSLFHFHDPELIPIGLILKLVYRKKVIYDVHEDIAKQVLTKTWIPTQTLRIIMSFILKFIETIASKQMSAIIPATHSIADNFKETNFSVVPVMNYPKLDEIPLSHPSSISTNTQYMCYIGGLTQSRGIFEMTEACHRNNIKLVLAGTFYPEVLENELFSSYNGIEIVDYRGQMDRQGVVDILSKATAGLVILHPLKNYIDSLPTKMFEYMAAGIPVIASSFPLCRQIIEKYNCGICVDPLNVMEISDAIRWILANPLEAQEMGKNGRLAVEQEYNWKNEETKLLNLYDQILKIS